jgi:hypothetical protein
MILARLASTMQWMMVGGGAYAGLGEAAAVHAVQAVAVFRRGQFIIV